jgi:glycosyltransferase involved in cell wall biosynthesis
MNVWIVNPYGTLPSEGWREYRSSMLSRALADCGHDVTWWLSDFEHRSKTFRTHGFVKDPLLPDRVNVYLVPSSAYKRNISAARIRYEHLFGRRFEECAVAIAAPDVIVLTDPSLFYSSPVVRYANKVGAKLVVDVLDLWPEQFQLALPRFLRPFANLVFAPLYRRRQRLVNRANGIAAVSKDHLRSVNPPKDRPHLVVYLGLDYQRFAEESLRDPPVVVKRFVEGSDLTLVYAGTLGAAYDINTVLQATEAVAVANARVKFIFAGDGPHKRALEDLAARYPKNILFLGAIPSSQLPAIYKLCHAGLCSYNAGSTVTMPVKLYDYLAGGLYVLYSIKGEAHELLSQNTCGIYYPPEDPPALCHSILNLATSLDGDRVRQTSTKLAQVFDERVQHLRFVKFIENVIYQSDIRPNAPVSQIAEQ